MNINVTKDGYVHVGRNEWASLEEIQQAVLENTNPGLTANCPEGKPPKPQAAPRQLNRVESNSSQEPLELPSMVSNRSKQRDNRLPTSNAFDLGHLPLPSMLQREDRKKQKQSVNVGEQEALELPSMTRR